MRRVFVCLLLIAALTVGCFAAFPDTDGHWAKHSIETMAEKNVVNGYGDGTFRPEGMLTRAEFLAMCVRFSGLSLEQSETDPWWRPCAQAAETAGWELPFGTTADEMEKTINRQEMAVLVKCTADAVSIEQPAPVLHRELESMNDCSVLAEEIYTGGAHYYTSVDQCVRLGFLGGYPDGEFKPHRTLTRAEAATVLRRLDAARQVWEQGGKFIVFTDRLKIWQTYGENDTTIHSAKDGEIVSEITVADECRDEWKLGFDVINANGKYFWGEPGFYEYDDSGSIKQLTDLPAIDYGFDASDGSIVFLTHDKSVRVVQWGGGVYTHAADSVARLRPDGTVETLLAAGAPIELAEAEQRGELTKVDRASDGDVWVQMSYTMGMSDHHVFRVVIQDGVGKVVPTGLWGSGYSF